MTLLITSSTAFAESELLQPPVSGDKAKCSQFGQSPRHFMVISKPCLHSDCPPRDGFIRGQYESIEFIREIPLKIKRSSSTTELLKPGRARPSSSLDRTARLHSMQERLGQDQEETFQTSNLQVNDLSPHQSYEGAPSVRGRKRGRTISFAESRGDSAKGEAVDTFNDESDELAELNPVEWVMVTRSDPGGSVPRFLVERGTPSGIVSDASKFVNWALKKEHSVVDDYMEETKEIDEETTANRRASEQDLEAYQTNGHLVGLAATTREPNHSIANKKPAPVLEPEEITQIAEAGLLANIADIARSGINSYAPQVLVDQLPSHQPNSLVAASATAAKFPAKLNGTQATKDTDETRSVSSASSVISFVSAEDRMERTFSQQAVPSLKNSSTTQDGLNMSSQEKELAKLDERKRVLDEKLAKSREKEQKDKEDLTSRDEERLRKAEEKHTREVQKQEEKYKKEVAKLEAKKTKYAAKEEERRKRAEDKDEKSRLVREKEEWRQQFEVVCKERELLREQVGALQKENTALVAKMGKMKEGHDLLKDVRAELYNGSRSRSGSIKMMRSGSSATSSEVAASTEKEKMPMV